MRYSSLLIFLLGFFNLFPAEAQFTQVDLIGSQRLGLVQLNRPASATFGPDGHLYFINEDSDEIFVYSTNGTFIKSISTILNGDAIKPRSIAVNNAGLIYLLSDNSWTIILLDNDGNFLQEIGSIGSGPDQFIAPIGIALDGVGNIWVTDYGNNRVKKLNENGVYISEFPSESPTVIDVKNNAVYVFEQNSSSIKKYSMTGTVMYTLTFPGGYWITEIEVIDDENLFAAAFGYGIFSCDLISNSYVAIPEPQNDSRMIGGGLALQNDNLFITDLTHKVFKYNIPLNSIEAFLECKANGQFNIPSQIVKDENQNIYVTDVYNHRIQVFDSDGNFIRKFGSYGSDNGGLILPQDLAVDSNGDCYVLNNNGVSVFDDQGTFLRQFSVDGYGGIAVDQNYLYIAGPLHQGIQRLDKNGVFQELIIEGGAEPGKTNGLRDFVIDEFGNFYVAELWGKRVQIFDNNGVLLQTIGQPGQEEGEFSAPIGITRDQQGRIYIADVDGYNSSRVQIFDQDGVLLAVIKEGLIEISGVEVNSDGRVFVSDGGDHHVKFFEGDLDILEVPEIEVLLPLIAYGDPDLQLVPTSPSNGAYQFKILSGTDAEVSDDGVLTVLGAGQVSVRVTQSPTPQYTQGVAIVTIDISKAELLATADNQVKTYGDENPVLTFQYQGFKGDDSFSDINTLPQISTNATITSSVGVYTIDLNNGADDNYEFNYVPGQLTIEKAPLIATAENKSRKYGEDNPQFTIQYTGFLNNDTFADLNVQPVSQTSADVTSPVGNYQIQLSGASDNNYEIEYVAGDLEIGKALLIVTIDNQSRIYGDANPVFTALYDGFVNNDDISDIDTPPVLNTVADAFSSAGQYPIHAINGLDNNYEFVDVAGVLTITKALLIAKAEDKSREYNAANPIFTIEYDGFKNNDDESDITTPPTGSTTATQSSPVGTYTIFLTGGVSANYDFTFVDGELIIIKASQQISFGPLPSPLFNTVPPFALNATSNSGLTITYAVTSGPASIAGNMVTLSGDLGIVTIEATQVGNGNYEAASPVSQSFEVVLKPVTGVEDLDASLKVYPNPSKGEFRLSSPDGIQAYQILDGKGILVYERDNLGKEEDHLVNVESLSGGIYFLVVETHQGKKLTRKISIVR